jgi:hypothetical protein
MKNKILAICITSMFLLTSTLTVTATIPIKTISPVSDDNEGNGIRITVNIYPLIARYGQRSLYAGIQSKNISHMLNGSFTIKLTYKDNELLMHSMEGGFYSYFGYSGIVSNISFSQPVIGTLFVEFTGSGKDYGLHESITLSVIIFKTKPYTWGSTPW